MTKRLLAALLAAVMVVSMIVVPAYAAEEEQTQQVGYCQHCKEVIPADKWLPWDAKNTGPRTGHYYLAEDIPDQTAQININLDDDLLRNKICLDLRGRTYTVTGLRPFLIYGIFSIMDSVGGGEIAVTGASNAHGGFAMMSKSTNSKDGSGELNIYSGTIRRINTATDLVSYGGLLYIAGAATLNLYGGTLIGGEVVPHLISKTNYAPLGGTIFATAAASVNIYGGTVTGGISRSGTLYKYGSTTETQKFEGTAGNLYLEGGSVLNLSGGVIENGYADVYGGNIYANSAELNITGGIIRGGATVGAGGNLCFNTVGTFKMSGGYITGGTCKTRGGNLFVNATNVALDISGGVIDGDMSVGLFKSFILSGAPKILMGNGNGLRLQRSKDENQKYDKVIDISGLTEGAEVYLDGNRHNPVFTTVLENPESYLGYFKDAIRADISVDESGALKVVQGNTGYCPHCWESGQQATWTAFDNSAPNANITVTSQHAYLAASASRTRLLIINAGVDYVMDTNGCTLTVTGYKFANLYGTLSIMDSVGGGIVTGTGHPIANGGVIMGSSTGVFNMYSGTLSRTVKSGEEDKTVLDGGILHAPAGSVTNIYGGIIRDGIAAKSYKSAPVEPCGGNIYSAGVFRMEGGILLGGKAKSTQGYINDGAGTVIATDKTYYGRGGNLYVSGTATISGGHIIGGSASYGGNVYTTTNLAINGGVIRDGVTNDALNNNDWGGNLYYTGVKEATIENAIVRGGKTPNLGGNINIYNTTLRITDSYIADGTAGIDASTGRGGNVYVNATSKLYLNNTIVSNGWSYDSGGNVYTERGSLLQMNGGVISCGTTENKYGGNVFATGFHMIGGRVVGGTAKASVAGNIYIPANAADYVIVEPAADGTPAAIANGTSARVGGNIFIDKGATGTFTGAIISNGSGDTKNASASDADNLYVEQTSKATLTDCTITGIVADSGYGNGVVGYGEVTLKGNTNIINTEKKSCVYMGKDGRLVVDESFCGKTSVAFYDTNLVNIEEPQGTALIDQHSATGVFSGEILLEGCNGRDYGLPAIFAEAGDSKLYIASAAVVDPAKGTTDWYKDNDSAAAELTPSSYLKLFKAENALNLTKDAVVDINGNNLTVTGSGTLYGFDSKNDDFTAFGTVTAGADVEIAPQHMAPNGNRYIAVAGEGGTSFHRLAMAVTGVSLRPATAGIYYKATWECDDILKEKLESFGVAVSTVDMPGSDFATDADTLYTTVAKENFVSGMAVNSALIENIVKSGEDNQTRGNMPIYAAPYAVVDGVTVIGDDYAPTMGGAIYSLKTVLQGINRVWPKLTDGQQESIRQLYAVDAAVLDTWDLYHITADINGTAAVRPLKVLTLGHSLAVDSGHMLNMIADAEGFDQPMEIATLYYSGCPLYKHVNYIKDNAGVYQLYVSSTVTPDKPPVIISGVTMKYGIEYAEWDVIVMQGGVFEIAHDATYTDGNIQFIQDYVNQYKTNPNMVFAWHMPWACPTTNSLRDQYPYSPNTYYTSYTAFNDDRTTMFNAMVDCVGRNIVTDNSFIYLIPSGTAIENALSSYLVEKDLHRDYVHVSDLGRVIASYTWYCNLAGIDHLDEIKLNAIPKAFLKSTADLTQDRVLTDMEKAIILESVNNALANPLAMTQSQYTVAP